VIRWIEANCVHTQGRWIGKPFRFLTWQKALILALFAVDAHGVRIYRWALIGVPKKNGKTELMAASGKTEMLTHGFATVSGTSYFKGKCPPDWTFVTILIVRPVTGLPLKHLVACEVYHCNPKTGEATLDCTDGPAQGGKTYMVEVGATGMLTSSSPTANGMFLGGTVGG